MPAFAFDPAKSAANRAKHGIDFVEAQELWADPDRVELTAHSATEPRVMVTGRIGGKVWSCVYTSREETIRLISCRRARAGEIRRYTDDYRGGV